MHVQKDIIQLEYCFMSVNVSTDVHSNCSNNNHNNTNKGTNIMSKRCCNIEAEKCIYLRCLRL